MLNLKTPDAIKLLVFFKLLRLPNSANKREFPQNVAIITQIFCLAPKIGIKTMFCTECAHYLSVTNVSQPIVGSFNNGNSSITLLNCRVRSTYTWCD